MTRPAVDRSRQSANLTPWRKGQSGNPKGRPPLPDIREALAKVLEVPLSLAPPACTLVALIKPQFEVGPGAVGKGGVVRDPALHAAVCERMGIETGCDLFKLMDIAEELITPMMDHMVRVDRSSLTLGFAGVYSTFLLHAERASKRFGVPARDILVELGRKKMIGGQEDMILDTAMTMAKERGIQFEESV